MTVLSLELIVPQGKTDNTPRCLFERKISEDDSKHTVRSLTIDNSGEDSFSVNSDSCCLGIPDNLKDLYQRTVKGMSEEQCSQVANLLVEYQDILLGTIWI